MNKETVRNVLAAWISGLPQAVVGVVSIRPIRSLSGANSFFLSDKRSQVDNPLLNRDLSAPFVPLRGEIDACHAGTVRPVFFQVPHIFVCGNIPKVNQPIIKGITIDMVNSVGFGPVDKLPDNAVRPIMFAKNGTLKASDLFRVKGWFFGVLCIPAPHVAFAFEQVKRALFPSQKTTIGIIAKKLEKRCLIWQENFSHCAVLSRGGQGRSLLVQRFRPVFSNRITICSQQEVAA